MKKIRIFSIFVWAVWAVGGAEGQYYTSQQGRLLDASNRVGSMGINTPTNLDGLTARVNDMLMTGNVTGGRSFQGVMPYGSTYEMSSQLGSSSLNTFYRDSTGVGDLQTSGLSQPQFYTGNSSGVTGIYGRVPGYSGDMARVSQPLGQRNTLMTSSNNRPLGGSVYSNYSGLSSGSEGSYGAGVSPGWSGQGMQLDTPEPAQWGTASSMRGVTGRIDARSYQALERSALGGSEQGQPVETTEQEQLQNANRFSPWSADSERTPDSSYEPGGEMGQPLANETEPDLAANAGQAEPSTTDKLLTSTATTDAYVKVMRERFDEAANQGHEYLNEGKYYRASQSFERAIRYRPDAASTYLDWGKALFAAGEFINSARAIDKALTLDANLAKIQKDLRMVFDNQGTYSRRLKELLDWQTKSGNPALQFLAGYVQYQAGQSQTARKNLAAVEGVVNSAKVLIEAIDSITAK